MNYWLFKTEPEEYSIEDLKIEKTGHGIWDGIRNYQARNILRDQVQVGDGVLIYHSSCKRVGVAGVAKVIRGAYPDPAQFNELSPYFDVKATCANPRWFCVDITYQREFEQIYSLKQIKINPALQDMVLLKQSRLSIQPVTADQWQAIIYAAGEK